MGYPSALSAKTWGYYDVLFKGNEFGFQRPYGSYAMENVPIGHRERRAEGIPVLKQKFVDSVSPKLAANQWAKLDALCADRDKLAATPVDDFMALLVA